jgi:hypothetical protein
MSLDRAIQAAIEALRETPYGERYARLAVEAAAPHLTSETMLRLVDATQRRAEKAEAEVERLRALTVGDPTSIYHDHATERALADRLAERLMRYPWDEEDVAALAEWEERRRG